MIYFKKLQYVKNDYNKGPGICRNIGMSIASGEYITFLDSDDWPDLMAYTEAVEILNSNCSCDIVIWGIKNEFNNITSSNLRINYKSNTIIDNDLALNIFCNSFSLDMKISSYLGNKLFRRSYINKKKFKFTDYYFEDVIFTFETIADAKEIAILPNVYTHYFQRPKSIVHSFSEKYIIDMYNVVKYIKNLIKNQYPKYEHLYMPLVEKCSKTLFTIMYSNVYEQNQIKEFLIIYFNNFSKLCDTRDIINYLDGDRIKNIILNL